MKPTTKSGLPMILLVTQTHSFTSRLWTQCPSLRVSLPRQGLDPGRGRHTWGRGVFTVRSSYPVLRGWNFGTSVSGWARNGVRQG